jgi:hypothetical protein
MISTNQKRIYEFDEQMSPRVALELLNAHNPAHLVSNCVKNEELEEEACVVKQEPVDEDEFFLQTDSWSAHSIFVADGFLSTEDIKPESCEVKTEPETTMENKSKTIYTKRKTPKQTYPKQRPKFEQNVRERIFKEPYTCPFCEKYITEFLNGHVSSPKQTKIIYFIN